MKTSYSDHIILRKSDPLDTFSCPIGIGHVEHSSAILHDVGILVLKVAATVLIAAVSFATLDITLLCSFNIYPSF